MFKSLSKKERNMPALKRLIGLTFLLLSLVTLEGLRAQANPDACPQPRSHEPCIQVIVFAQNPGNGRCCQFANPCSVPPGWGEVFFSAEECAAAP
jgi:hypothetical protein